MLFFLLMLVAGAAEQAGQPIQPPSPACTSPEHRQFDFWIGQWEVYRTGETRLRAHSRIDKLHDGCVIGEQWMPLRGGGGSSLNHFDTHERRWRQTWMDSANARVEFDGGLVGGKMVLTGFWRNAQGPGKDGLVRMSYSTIDGGAVRQFGEISTDHGLTWSPFFDFTYKPRAAAAK